MTSRSVMSRRGATEAMAALAAGGKVTDAATAGQVTERTVYRWLQDSTFRQAIHDARRRVVDEAIGRLVIRTGEMIDRLTAMALEPASIPASVRLRAITSALQLTRSLMNDDETELRLQRLEMAAGIRRKDAA